QAQTGRWQWPTPPPHQVVHAFDAPDHPYGPGHRGIDIAATAGEQVRAVEGGTVRFAGVVTGRGVVSVLHPDGLISTYEPVTAEVSDGQAVEEGESLGVLETADAADSHCTGQDCLHLGARQAGAYLDPLPLLGVRGPSVLLPWSGPGGEGLGGGASTTQRAGPWWPGAGGVAPRPGGARAARQDRATPRHGGGGAVAERVGTDVRGDPGSGGVTIQQRAHGAVAEPAPTDAEEQRLSGSAVPLLGEHRESLPLPACDRVQGRRTDRDDPLLGALAGDPDRALPAVDPRSVQRHQL